MNDVSLPTAPSTTVGPPLLEVDHLQVYFPVRAGDFGATTQHVRAVDDITLRRAEGEILGLLAESRCGKTTLARTIVRPTDATNGTVRFRGTNVTEADCGAATRSEDRPLESGKELTLSPAVEIDRPGHAASFESDVVRIESLVPGQNVALNGSQ